MSDINLRVLNENFPQGSVLCSIPACKEGDIRNGILCLTPTTISFAKAGFLGDNVIHFPRFTSGVELKNGIFGSTISITFNNAVTKFLVDKEPAKLFFSGHTSLVLK